LFAGAETLIGPHFNIHRESNMRLYVSPRVTLTVAVAFLAILATLLGVVANDSLNFAKRQAVAQQEASMRVAWDVLRQKGSGFRIDGDRLLVGDHVLNGDFATVDHIRDLVGGVATVFMGDTRVTTNVIKPGGGRADGTPLAQGPVYDAVLRRGESIRGETKILGSPYIAAYDPIKNASGEVVGVLFVGVPKADFFQPIYRQMILMALTVLIVGAVGVAGTILIIRGQLRVRLIMFFKLIKGLRAFGS
jgi:methyl-accepting chemotaxis protein